MGLLLKQRLAELQDRHARVVELVRGEGLMIGIKLRVNNGEFAAAARAEHLLVIPAGDNVVRLLPPLIIAENEVSEALNRLEATCRRMEADMDKTNGVKA
jgi:acetylornithine/N-succinyldiaminopimelate aminotransferase